jgi:hypothetical protein
MNQWAANEGRELPQRPRRDDPGHPRPPAVQQNQSAPRRDSRQLTAGTGTASTNNDHSLLTATAKLALATAKQVRTLVSVTGKTYNIPDACALGGPFFAVLARQDRPWTPHNLAYCWAQIILWILEHPMTIPEETLQALRTHANAYMSAESLQPYIMDCQLTRTWSGDTTNLRLTMSPELRDVGGLLSKVLVGAGCQIRYGAPPRGPLERLVSDSMNARQHH